MWFNIDLDGEAELLAEQKERYVWYQLTQEHIMAKTVNRIFDREHLRDIYNERDVDFEILDSEVVPTGFHHSAHYFVFKELSSGRIYECSVSVDNRFGDIFANLNNEHSCCEVEPVEVRIIKYKPVTK